MAAWQHDYYLLPQSKLIEHYGTVSDLEPLPAGDLNAVDWWANVPFPDKTEIEKILPAATSWSPSIDMWGSNSDNSFQVGYDEERKCVSYVTMRFDLRNESPQLREFVQKVVEFVARNEWVFFSQETGLILKPDYQVVATDLKLSTAQTFVTDPISKSVDDLH